MSQLSASEFKWENVGSQTCLVEFVLAEMIIRLLYWTADVPLISQINRAVENPSLLSAADSFWGNGGGGVDCLKGQYLLGCRVKLNACLEKY